MVKTVKVKPVKKAKPIIFPERAQFKTLLAVDQSYESCGISLYRNQQLVWVDKIDFKEYQDIHRKLNNNKTVFKKKHKREILRSSIRMYVGMENVDCVVVERARLYSAGFISIRTIAALSELISCIIDAVSDTIPVASCDSRCWKAHSVGKGNATKEETIKWCYDNVMTPDLIKDRDGVPLTDDEADSIGIGYAFYNMALLEIEE